MERETRQAADAVEFTYDWYREFVDDVRAEGYDIRRFSDGLDAGEVVLRHDVDLSVERALKLAYVEAEMDVQSTYCVLLTSGLYNPLERELREQLAEIASMGHEIALHFSTHEYWDDEVPSDAALREAVNQEGATLAGMLREPITTVSFHSPPEWVLNRELDGITSAYAPAYFGDITYVADSGQRWRGEAPDPGEFGERAQVLTHPGLYSETDASFSEQVERAVTAACRHANAKAQREFVAEDS